jgi:hypothetical protein
MVMAVVLLAGQGYAQWPCTETVFTDVNNTTQPLFCGWIERFSTLGITGGCSQAPPLFCPENPVTRGQMAVFLSTAIEIKKPGKVAVVAKSGGDYDNPAAAMSDLASWCRPASDTTTPCLVKIMPGEYDIGSSSLQMQNAVDIEGSGVRVTRIVGTVDSNTSGLVRGAGAEIRDLTVENRGNHAASNAIAIYNDNSWFYIKNVSATAWGATNNHYGIYLTGNGITYMDNVSAFAGSGVNGYGIYSNAASVSMTNVDVYTNPSTNSYGLYFYTPDNWIPGIEMSRVNVVARGDMSGNTYSYGIYNRNFVITMKDVKATAWGGTVYNYGIFNTEAHYGGGRLTLIDVVTDVRDGSQSFGVFNTNTGGEVTIDHSVVKAVTNSVRKDNVSAKFYVGATKLDGVTTSGTIKCAGVHDANYNFYATSCP